MLKRFNVKNFLSFNCNQDGTAKEFSMISGKIRSNNERVYNDGKIKLLKFASIYGANASGKSNIIKAMNFAKKTIIKGLPIGCTNMYCKIDSNNKERESYFEFEILLNGKYYAYGFEVLLSKRQFVSEWLVELNSEGKDKELFTRDIKNESYNLKGFSGSKPLYQKLMSDIEFCGDDVLFLSKQNESRYTIDKLCSKYPTAKILKKIYEWFDKYLEISYPEMPISNFSYYINQKNIEEVSNLLKAFSTGICNYSLPELNQDELLARLTYKEKEDLLKILEKYNGNNLNNSRICLRRPKEFILIEFKDKDNIAAKTIKFNHKNSNSSFELFEESDGTIRLLDLLEVLLTTNKNKVFVIDEFDRCLHPNLTCYFIKEFLKQAKKRNVQLIITTHESRLLDLNIVRQDEVWFVQKDNKGESDIYSLDEYNERFDKKIDKAYLDGRYGASPIFNHSLLEGDEY